MPNPENIEKHKFKKGQSGNPKGRPKILPELKEVIAKVLLDEKDGMTALEAMITKARNKAIAGDVRHFKELMDRYYGKSIQSIDLQSSDGSMTPKPTMVVSNEKTKEALDKIISKISKK